jgi:hypothetical protein
MDNISTLTSTDDDCELDDRWAKPVPEFKLAWSPLPGGLDDRIIAVFDRAILGPPSVVFRTKEVQLGELFATLSVSDANALHRRVTLAVKGDPLVERFGRLTRERRDRLVLFLAEARRRRARFAAGCR